jgi:uncharacterized membrane protein YgdD (TMEM256/DUF423 family)
MPSRANMFFGFAAASLAAATLLGAYASHGMRDSPAAVVEAVRTAVSFQFYHGLALLIVPMLQERILSRWVAAAGWLFVAGTLLFCGGIYASSLLGLGFASRVAPLGGTAFAAGWLAIAAAALIPRGRSS